MDSIPRAPDVAHRPARARSQMFTYWVAAMVFSTLVVLGARVWFDTLQTLWPTSDGTAQGLQFGSFLIVLGGVAAWWRPGSAAVAVGSTLRDWRMVLFAAVAAAGMAWVFVAVTGANAYSDADALFEVVLVPVGEELVFRGVLLGWLLDQLHRRCPGPVAARWAVVVAAVTFGGAHISNAFFGMGEFAIVQVLVATLMGLVLGALRIRTGSLVAPILVHAVVNGVNLMG